MKMSEIYNGSQWAHDLFLVNKTGATEYITGRSSTQKKMQKNQTQHVYFKDHTCKMFLNDIIHR